jgi:uncharacterized membrane protein HdeD (DUF308 family)
MRHWYLLLAAGALAILGGIVALLNPLAATLTATVLAAWVFIFVGGLSVLAVFSDISVGRKIWTVLLGLLAIFVGVNILGEPLKGVLLLTWVVAILFLAEGIVKIVMSFSLRDTPYFWMVLLSGAISALLGFMVLSNFPASAASILGILLAVDLISTGAGMVALALHGRGSPRAA